MKTAELLEGAISDGVKFSVNGAGKIKLTGGQDTVNKWLPVIREHKAALLKILSPARHNDPAACEGCDRYELVEIMGAGVRGCLYTAPGKYSDGWKRLPNDLERCIIH